MENNEYCSQLEPQFAFDKHYSSYKNIPTGDFMEITPQINLTATLSECTKISIFKN